MQDCLFPTYPIRDMETMTFMELLFVSSATVYEMVMSFLAQYLFQ